MTLARWGWVLGAVGAAASCPGSAWAQTRRPVVLTAFPAGVQRGQTAEVTVTGFTALSDTYRVLVQGGGVTARVVAIEPGADGQAATQLRMQVTASPDAAPGIREFRVANPQGVSNSGTLVVGDLPESIEIEPNDKAAQAQSIGAAGTVNGRLQADEDRDCYRFSARAGEAISFVLLAARLQERAHDGAALSDPVLTLRDREGKELATADDFYRADPMLAYRFDQAGEYVIEVRDARLQGAPGWLYRLTVARDPIVTGTFPCAVSHGQSSELKPIGVNVEQLKPCSVLVPNSVLSPTCPVRFAEGPGGTVEVPVTEWPETVESEGNDRFGQANPLPVPGGVSARVASPFDIDYFRIHAARAQAFRLEVEAARLASSLDPHLAVLDGHGTVLASSDEGSGRDPVLTWTAPAEGDYVVQVTDATSRGGEDYRYHLTVRPAEPDFTLSLSEDRAQAGPGGGAAWFVHATRSGGFSGEIQLSVSGLPAGMTADPARVPAGINDGVIVVSAAPNARPEAALVAVTGTGRVRGRGGEEVLVTREVAPLHAWYAGGGARILSPVATSAAAITDAPDVIVTPGIREVRVAPGQSVKIPVTLKRRDGFNGVVHLDLLDRHLKAVFADPLPAGVTIDENQSKLVVSEKETQGWITLKAAANALPVERLPLAVLGQVQVNYVVRQSCAGPAIALTVSGAKAP